MPQYFPSQQICESTGLAMSAMIVRGYDVTFELHFNICIGALRLGSSGAVGNTSKFSALKRLASSTSPRAEMKLSRRIATVTWQKIVS
jgi:hypothetical protein